MTFNLYIITIKKVPYIQKGTGYITPTILKCNLKPIGGGFSNKFKNLTTYEKPLRVTFLATVLKALSNISLSKVKNVVVRNMRGSWMRWWWWVICNNKGVRWRVWLGIHERKQRRNAEEMKDCKQKL